MQQRAVFLCFLFLSTIASAHGGGLDRNGCHNDRRNGGYHCHRGPSAPAPAPAPRRAPAPQPVYGPHRPVVVPPVVLPVDRAPAPTPVQPVIDPPSGPLAGRAPIVGNATVLDGDTIQINGQRIRLWGIDAFEAAQRCSGPDGDEPCGARATHELDDMIGNHQVVCIYRDTDAYNRTVALCRVGALDLGASLVRKGLAVAFTRYALDYSPDEAEARANRVGAWAGSFTSPTDYRAGESDSVAVAQRTTADGGTCLIKGNINREGERIYHMPTDPYYRWTNPEAMFCTEAEAQAAGFRRAGRPQ